MDKSVVFCLQEQVHAFQLSAVGLAGLHGVDAGGVDAGVAQDVRQPDDVLLQLVIRPGE